MKLTREIARQELARLASNPMLFPQSAEGKTELLDCLMRNCADAEHCAEVMTALLDTVEDPRSITASIATIASRTRRPDQAPPGCEQCYAGDDVTTGAAIWLPFVSVEIRGYSCARRCSCARGRWLAERDRDRELGQQQTEQRPRGIVAAGAVDVKALAAGDRL